MLALVVVLASLLLVLGMSLEFVWCLVGVSVVDGVGGCTSVGAYMGVDYCVDVGVSACVGIDVGVGLIVIRVARTIVPDAQPPLNPQR